MADCISRNIICFLVSKNASIKAINIIIDHKKILCLLKNLYNEVIKIIYRISLRFYFRASKIQISGGQAIHLFQV